MSCFFLSCGSPSVLTPPTSAKDAPDPTPTRRRRSSLGLPLRTLSIPLHRRAKHLARVYRQQKGFQILASAHCVVHSPSAIPVVEFAPSRTAISTSKAITTTAQLTACAAECVPAYEEALKLLRRATLPTVCCSYHGLRSMFLADMASR